MIKHGDRNVLSDSRFMPLNDIVDTVESVKKARNRLGKQIDMIGFDCCLMSSVEIAYALRDSASYIVASEELEPIDGWNYYWLQVLNEIRADMPEDQSGPGKDKDTGKVPSKLKANKLKVKKKTVKVRYSKLRRKAQIIKANKVKKVKKGNSAKTKIRYKLVKANKRKKAFVVYSSGKIKVKKGTKRGTYKLTIKAVAAKTDVYKSSTKKFVVTVKIR